MIGVDIVLIIKIILQLLVAGAFAYFGYLKLTGAEQMKQAFAKFGYSDRFLQITGILEIVAAACLLLGIFLGWFTNLGGLLIIGITFGAMYSHIVKEQSIKEALPAFVMALVTSIIMLMHVFRVVPIG